MKRILLRGALAAVAICLAGLSGAYQADDASTPTLWKLPQAERIEKDKAREGPHYAKRMEFYFEDNKKAEPGCIVFLGDSITEGFPIDAAFNGELPADAKRKVVNRGTSGDHLEGMIERLDICVRDLKPKKVYIMGGTNDIWWVRKDYKEGEVKVGFERLIKAIKAVAPEAEIIVQTILPINHDRESKEAWDLYNKWVSKANDQIREVAKKEKVKVLDTNKAFTGPDGYFVKRYTFDGVHPTPLGYLTWIDLIYPDKASPKKMQVWKNLAKFYGETLTPTHPLTAVNKSRLEDELIQFKHVDETTSKTTGTNVYGIEVLVQNDKVTSVSKTGDMPIPEDPEDYVLSGHGKAMSWLQERAPVGTMVKVKDGVVETTLPEDNDEVQRKAVGDAYYYEKARARWMLAYTAGLDVDKYYPKVDALRFNKKDAAAGAALLNELRALELPKAETKK